MKNAIKRGDILTVTAPAAVTSGDLVQVGQVVGVAVASAAIGEPVEISRIGVFDLPKNNAEAWTEGQQLWWDGTEVRNATAVGRLVIGFAARVGGELAAATTGQVLLDGVSRADD